jgi:hypothetical protein
MIKFIKLMIDKKNIKLMIDDKIYEKIYKTYDWL